MTMLSNNDILQEIGNNVYIYPFRKANLKGSSYNLTASKLAWDIKTKVSIYDKNQNRLIIQPNSTALIETNEAIWVSSKIAGTYHSKVALVSKGLSHIGTTLDPEYIGTSLIAVHNHSSDIVHLTPESETFVTLKLHYVNTAASVRAGNNPGRPDVLLGFNISEEDKDWLDESFRNTPDALKAKLIECSDFVEILEQRKAVESRLQSKSKRRRKWIVANTICSLMFFIPLVVNGFISSKDQYKNQGWYEPVVNTAYGIAGIGLLGLVTANYQLFELLSEES